MAGALEAAGYACVPEPSDADVLIYNTCSIRDKAEQKVYSALGTQVRSSELLSDVHVGFFFGSLRMRVYSTCWDMAKQKAYYVMGSEVRF
jgi:hypothetical protein